MRRSAQGMGYFEATAKHTTQILLREQPQPGLVGSSGIGALGYYSRLPILDIYGIIDPKIAHSKAENPRGVRLIPGHHRSNADYVFARQPDFLLIPRARRYLPMPALVALWEHPKLESQYVWDPRVKGYRRKRTPPVEERTSR